ncbi:MAG: tRNA lysidine(34) synthetase TilS [Gammaproteobacteria bacterium]
MSVPGFSTAQLQHILSRFPAKRYWVAYSGGLDSHVLLHVLARLPNKSVHAVHVDHGLQENSAQWVKHCEAICAALQIPLLSLHINIDLEPGGSLEAAARDARYQAIASLMEDGDVLLTAHHQDDQAETVLLQLLRGAGPAGLAGMPACSVFSNGLHVRPLLNFTQAQLRAYAEMQRLVWIEDQSNRDLKFDRNYLRHEITPRLRARWPSYARTLSRSAAHSAEAAELMEALAEIDLHPITQSVTPLSITALRSLDEARQRNALRTWIKRLDLPVPNTTHLDHILHDVVNAKYDSTPLVHWRGAEIRRYRDLIYAMRPLSTHDAKQILMWETNISLTLPNDLGHLTATPAKGKGIKAALWQTLTVTVRFRRGGEQCRPVGRKETHELKKLFQESGIPPWQRDRIPLVYLDEQLAAVAGLWVCEPFQASPEEEGIEVCWGKPNLQAEEN